MKTEHSKIKTPRYVLAVPALAYFLLFAIGMVFNQIGTFGASFPTPYDPVEKAQEYYGNFQVVIQTYAFFIFWSALPLGIFTAFVTNRLKLFCNNHRGIGIATFGGYAAAIFIAFSWLCTWVLPQPGIASEPGITRGIQLLGFQAGGTGNVVMSGLLILGISVTAGLAKAIPKWVKWFGIVLAVISLVSMLNMVFPQASILLPLGRFLGMIWLVIAGFSISRFPRK